MRGVVAPPSSHYPQPQFLDRDRLEIEAYAGYTDLFAHTIHPDNRKVQFFFESRLLLMVIRMPSIRGIGFPVLFEFADKLMKYLAMG